MAGLRYGATLTVSAPASLPNQVMQFAPPANRRVWLRAVEVWTTGATPGDAPIVLQVGRLLPGGSGFFVSATTVKHSIAAESVQTTIGRFTTTQPLIGVVLATMAFHPQAAMEWRPGGVGLLLPRDASYGIQQVSGPLVDMTIQAHLEE